MGLSEGGRRPRRQWRRLAALAALPALYAGDVIASAALLPTDPPFTVLAPDSLPCSQARFAIVTESGVGTQTAYEMAARLGPVAHRVQACVVVLDYGSVMDGRGNVRAIMTAVLEGRAEDAEPFPVLLMGNSAGGIAVQHQANRFIEEHGDRIRVAAVVADSTPSGPEDLKPPFTQDLAHRCDVPLGQFFGQTIVRAWQTFEEATRRGENVFDPQVRRRIRYNTDRMQSRLTLSQMCLIGAGYPQQNLATPEFGVPHHYLHAANPAADEVVNVVTAVPTIDARLGGGLQAYPVPEGIHAAAYLLWDRYRVPYEKLVLATAADLHPPPPLDGRKTAD